MKKLLSFSILTLLFTATNTFATIYYVATTGSSTTCNNAQNINTPLNTITAGIACLSANDTLYIRGGTYNQNIATPSVSGTSWSSPVWIGAYQSETVIVRGTGGNQTLRMGDGGDYVVFDKLHVDGSNTFYAIDVGSGTTRFQNGEVFFGGNTCEDPLTNSGVNIFINARSTRSEFINNDIHDSGCGYGFYVQGDNVLIDGNRIYDNAGYAIQVYNGDTTCCLDNVTIINNIMYGNSFFYGYGAITMNHGTNGLIYNNLIYNNNGGIDIARSADGARFYNNTVYGNGPGLQGLRLFNVSDVVIRNNIIYNNSAGNIDNQGTGTIFSNNLCNSTGGGCAIAGNPNFENTATGNFHLTSSSTNAIDQGTDLSQTFTTDITGISRPQGSAYDIGAYEFVQADTTDPVVTITAPTSNTTYSTATTPITTIAGTATDAVGTTGITWANAATSGSGSGSGCSGETSCNWSVSSISLNEGSNAITITGADAAANEGTDTITVTLDTTPPSRNNGAPSGTLDAGTTSTSISLTTNETATCKYGTSAGVAYGSLPNTFSSTNSTSHSTTVGSLSDGNSYTYYVRCQDVLNNANTSDFSISFSVDEESVVTINPPSSLNTTHSSTVTVLSPPSTLDTTNTGSITVLGQPSSLNQTGGEPPVFLGQPLNLNNL